MKIAILGYGLEGRASYQYWSKLYNHLTILDQKEIPTASIPKNSSFKFSQDIFSNLSEYDLVIRSPSIRPDSLGSAKLIWSATNEFFHECPAPIIGVTGTKGKGTTCTLIQKILESSGYKVHLVGNIGTPALQELPKIKKEDLVVFELSSFQLWDLKKSPHLAVVLMVEPDHLDVHSSMQEYLQAKAQIAKYQKATDILIHHPTNPNTKEIIKGSLAQTSAYLTQQGAHLRNNKIIINNQVICNLKELKLIGQHNIENIAAAITASWVYTQDLQAIRKAVIGFTGLPHRLESVPHNKQQNVRIYNDSFSSNPSATIAAILAFPNTPLILILGGRSRSLDYQALIKVVMKSKNLKKIILIGEVKEKLHQEFIHAKISHSQVCNNLAEAVQLALQSATPNNIILFSPGHPSFDMFKNFQQRGQKFKKLIQKTRSELDQA